MVNTQLFRTGTTAPAATHRNRAGGPAYALPAAHRLAQVAATGCLADTYYADAKAQLDDVLALVAAVDPVFVAKTALYARHHGQMKDMPALLAAALCELDVALLARVFDRVVDNGKVLRAFVQIVRSGAVGRRSFGSAPKRLVQQWLNTATETRLLQASIGNAPSLADVVKMVHPKPAEPWRAAWFAWLIGKPYDLEALPPATRAFEQFKRARAAGKSIELPDVPFQMLTSVPLTNKQWARAALAGSWQTLRQNLNTLARHGAFDVRGFTAAAAAKLRDPAAIARARVLPYQLMTAYHATEANVPAAVREALRDAMDLALVNVPRLAGQVVVCPDVSGSMSSPATFERGSATTVTRCIDVAALVAAAMLHRHPGALVMPFERRVVPMVLDAADGVMANAKKLADVGGGGTNCSAPLAELNRRGAHVDVVILVSDNESWIDASRQGATATMSEWDRLKGRCPKARLVCIDVQPYGTTQAIDREDILNVGGFSDAVFDQVRRFAAGEAGPAHWVDTIERIPLDVQ